MSGLCGILRWNSNVEVYHIQKMMDPASYRGPDGQNIHCNGSVGMGYLAHNLTPESEFEKQPLVHDPTGIVISADIRLDNRSELIESSDKESFSDTEIVLSTYLKYKEKWAEKIIGDFAVAIWDPRERTVQLARDPMGMKTLHYSVSSGMSLWGTEIQQLLAVPGVLKKLNRAAVTGHLSGVHLPVGMSFYENIFPVEPGEMITFKEKELEKKRFWKFDPEKKVRYKRETDYMEHFQELFLSSVENRLRSSKPVGISLSGGMDSGSVASVAGWLYEQKRSRFTPEFRAYAWAFEELKNCDERRESRLITDRYNISTTDVPADNAWPLNDYPEHSPHADHPYVFYYNELIDSVNKHARDSGTGMLMTGERGDALIGHWAFDYPGLLRDGRFLSLSRELSAHGKAVGLSKIQAYKKLLIKPYIKSALKRRQDFSYITAEGYPSYLTSHIVDMEELKRIRLASMPSISMVDEARRSRYMLVFSAMSVRRLELLEREQAMRGVDHADPWSDRRLTEYILSIPQHYVHRFTEEKRIARKALEPMLTGYLSSYSSSETNADPTPFFNKGLFEKSRHVVEDLIENSHTAELGFVDNKILLQDFRNTCQGTPMRYDIWWYITMEMWLRKHWK